MSDAIIIQIIVVGGGILTMIVKNHIDKKQTDKKIDSRGAAIDQRLAAIENLFTTLDMKTERLIQDDSFRNNFKNVIRMKITQVVNGSRLNDVHRNILYYFGQLVEEFGLLYFYSAYRKTNKDGKRDLKAYVNDTFEVKKACLKKYIQENYAVRKSVTKEIKNYSPDLKKFGARSICFYELLGISRISTISNVMIDRLIRNGFDEMPDGKGELTNLFENYVDDVSTIYLDTIQLWTTLNDYQDEDV
jgi:hypothetical protein